MVRTTHSGMGCPDWPRCFGYYIPPTADEQVRFHGEKAYRKGMMIIENDTLWRAKSNFVSATAFERTNWEKYPKHDYSDFVVYQTWVEYINRLLGALLGIFVFGMFVTSFSYRKTQPSLILISFALLFVTGFQAWLGKLVVDGNLIPESISIHMLGALAMLVLAQWTIFKISTKETQGSSSSLPAIALLAAIFTLIQILIGTQVREEIDVLAKGLGEEFRSVWADSLSSVLTMHMAFSLLLTAVSGYAAYLTRSSSTCTIRRWGKRILAFIGIELIAGISLKYFGMPALAQPIHLLVATLLFWSFFSLWLDSKSTKTV